MLQEHMHLNSRCECWFKCDIFPITNEKNHGANCINEYLFLLLLKMSNNDGYSVTKYGASFFIVHSDYFSMNCNSACTAQIYCNGLL